MSSDVARIYNWRETYPGAQGLFHKNGTQVGEIYQSEYEPSHWGFQSKHGRGSCGSEADAKASVLKHMTPDSLDHVK